MMPLKRRYQHPLAAESPQPHRTQQPVDFIGGAATRSGFPGLGLLIGVFLAQCDCTDLSGPQSLHHLNNRASLDSRICDVLCVAAYMRFWVDWSGMHTPPF